MTIGRALCASLALALLALSGCQDFETARVPTSRYLPQNAPSNTDVMPPGSVPPSF